MKNTGFIPFDDSCQKMDSTFLFPKKDQQYLILDNSFCSSENFNIQFKVQGMRNINICFYVLPKSYLQQKNLLTRDLRDFKKIFQFSKATMTKSFNRRKSLTDDKQFKSSFLYSLSIDVENNKIEFGSQDKSIHFESEQNLVEFYSDPGAPYNNNQKWFVVLGFKEVEKVTFY